MKIIIKKGNWFKRNILRGMYDTETKNITIWDTKHLFNILSHELGHHNFQKKYKNFPLWRKIISNLIFEHEIHAIVQEGEIVEFYI